MEGVEPKEIPLSEFSPSEDDKHLKSQEATYSSQSEDKTYRATSSRDTNSGIKFAAKILNFMSDIPLIGIPCKVGQWLGAVFTWNVLRFNPDVAENYYASQTETANSSGFLQDKTEQLDEDVSNKEKIISGFRKLLSLLDANIMNHKPAKDLLNEFNPNKNDYS